MTGGAASRVTPSMIPVVAPVHWRADAQGYGRPSWTASATHEGWRDEALRRHRALMQRSSAPPDRRLQSVTVLPRFQRSG